MKKKKGSDLTQNESLKGPKRNKFAFVWFSGNSINIVMLLNTVKRKEKKKDEALSSN